MKRVKFWDSEHLSENPLRKWHYISHVDVSWSLPQMIKLWSQFVDFQNSGAILTWAQFGVSGHFGHALLIFLIMVPHWLKHIFVFLCIIWRTCGSKYGGGHISDVLRRVLASITWSWGMFFELNIQSVFYHCWSVTCVKFYVPTEHAIKGSDCTIKCQ